MEDRHRQKLEEQYEESLLMLMMDDYAKADGRRLLEEFKEAQQRGTASELPEKLDLRCRQIIDRRFAGQERKGKICRGLQRVMHVAVIMLALMGISAATVLSVDALRVPVLNFFIHQTEKWAEASLQEPENPYQTDRSVTEHMAQNIPADYTVQYVRQTPDGAYCVGYTNKQGRFIGLDMIPASCSLNLDNEDVERTEISLAGYQAVLTEKGDSRQVMWLDEGRQMYMILSSNGWEEEALLELAVCLIAEE